MHSFTQFTWVWTSELEWLNYLKDIIKQSITSISLLRYVPVSIALSKLTVSHDYTELTDDWLLVSEFRMKREPALPMMEEERTTRSLYNTEILVRKLFLLLYFSHIEQNVFLGEADPRIQEKSGMKNYNIKLILCFGKNENEDKSEESEKKKRMEFIDIGILYDEGRKCATKGVNMFKIYFYFQYFRSGWHIWFGKDQWGGT